MAKIVTRPVFFVWGKIFGRKVIHELPPDPENKAILNGHAWCGELPPPDWKEVTTAVYPDGNRLCFKCQLQKIKGIILPEKL